MVGGVCGTAFACVTSYFEGKIIANNENYENIYVDNVCAMVYPAYAPRIIPKEAMEVLITKFEESGIGTNSFEYKLFRSYYLSYDPAAYGDTSIYPEYVKDHVKQFVIKNLNDFYSLEVEKHEGVLYIIDSSVTNVQDIERATEIFISVFDNDIYAVEKFCYEYNIKCGKLYCYSFAEGDVLTRDDLEGFNFEYIWEETEDGIIQKIFVD